MQAEGGAEPISHNSFLCHGSVKGQRCLYSLLLVNEVSYCVTKIKLDQKDLCTYITAKCFALNCATVGIWQKIMQRIFFNAYML